MGNLNIEGMVFCAPMAGISNPPYRLLARKYGAAMVYSEMISSNGLVYSSGKTVDMLTFTPEERPIGIQLFGAQPDIMNEAAHIVSQFKPDVIDLNFGCPVKKVVKKNGGAAVLKDLGLTRALIEAAIDGSDMPVTVKLRSGWDELSKVYLDAGKIAEDAGAAAVALHARTRSKHFSGAADWEDIRKLKNELSIPVIGNGDISCGEDARRMIDQTGCDAVMIGRAAMGNPWIFREINHYLETGVNHPGPTIEERIQVLMEHARILIEFEGEERAIRKMRGVFIRYTKGWREGAGLRRQIMSTETREDFTALLTDYLHRRGEHASDPA